MCFEFINFTHLISIDYFSVFFSLQKAAIFEDKNLKQFFFISKTKIGFSLAIHPKFQCVSVIISPCLLQWTSQFSAINKLLCYLKWLFLIIYNGFDIVRGATALEFNGMRIEKQKSCHSSVCLCTFFLGRLDIELHSSYVVRALIKSIKK